MEKLEPLSIWQIVCRALRIYKENFLRFIAIFAVVNAVFLPIWPVLSKMRGAMTAPGSSAHFVYTLACGLIAFTVSTLQGALNLAVLSKSVSEWHLGRKVSFREAYSFALGRLGRVIWASLLVGSVSCIGFFFCILPGFFLLLYFGLTPIIVLLEKSRVLPATERSKDLVSGNVLRLLGLFALSMLICLPVLVPQFFLLRIASEAFRNNFLAREGIFALLRMLLGTLMGPIGTTTFVLFYYDLRVRKENLTVEMLSEGFSAEKALSAQGTEGRDAISPVTSQAVMQELKPLSIWRIIGRSFRIYKDNFFRFFYTIVPVEVVCILIVPALIWLYHMVAGNDRTVTPESHGPYILIFMFLGMVVSIMKYSLYFAIFSRGVSEWHLGRKALFRRTYVFVLPRLWPVVLASLVVGVVCTTGFFLCILPGLLFVLWLALTTVVVVLERSKVMKAPERSKELVSGNVLRFAGLLLICILICSPLLLFPVPRTVTILGVMGYDMLFILLAFAPLQILAGTLIAPLLATAVILFYYDLRVRKESFTIEMLEERFEGEKVSSDKSQGQVAESKNGDTRNSMLRSGCLLTGLIILLLLGIVLASIGIPVLSEKVSRRRADDALAALRAQGFPTSLEELNIEPIQDSENGAVEYRKAVELLETIDHPYPEGVNSAWGTDPFEWSEGQIKAMRDFTNILDQILPLVEQALGKPRCVMIFDYSLAVCLELAPFIKSRDLFKLLSFRSDLWLLSGEDRKALDDILLMWQLPKLSHENRALLPGFITLICSQYGCKSLRTLVVEKGRSHLLTREDLATVVENPRIVQIQRLIAFDMCALLDTYEDRQRPEKERKYIKWPDVSDAAYSRSRANYINFMKGVIDALGRPFPEASVEIQALQDDMKDAQPGIMIHPPNENSPVDSSENETDHAELFSATLARSSVSTIPLHHYRSQAWSRLTRAGVAIEIYRNEHGKYPDSLDAIVEMVGERNLEDPFGAVLTKDNSGYTQVRFIYRRTEVSYELYSIGPDMADNNGQEMERKDNKGDIVWRSSEVDNALSAEPDDSNVANQ